MTLSSFILLVISQHASAAQSERTVEVVANGRASVRIENPARAGEKIWIEAPERRKKVGVSEEAGMKVEMRLFEFE